MLNGYEVSALVLLGSVAAGCLGSASGLGGAVLVIPALTLGLGIDLRYAIGAGLISALTISSVSLLNQIQLGADHSAVGVRLETAAVVGALAGALASPHMPTAILSALLGLVVLHSALHVGRGWGAARPRVAFGASPAPHPQLQAGLAVALFGTGALSGLLGVGGGSLYSPLLRRAVPGNTAHPLLTANGLIGLTAALSACLYLSRGYVHPLLAAPVLLGTLAGSLLGLRASSSKLFPALQPLCAICLAAFGIQLLLNAWEAYHS